MDTTNAPQISDNNTPLGKPATGRGQVELLAEAARLKFSDTELAELRRLYLGQHPQSEANWPQSDE